MARPKTGKPAKKGMCLTVSEQTRAELTFISEHYGESISALVSAWAAKEAKVIEKQSGKTAPLVGQESIEKQGS